MGLACFDRMTHRLYRKYLPGARADEMTGEDLPDMPVPTIKIQVRVENFMRCTS